MSLKKSLLFLIGMLMFFQIFAADSSYKKGSVVYVAVKKAKVDSYEVFYGDALVVEGTSGKKIQVHLKENESVCGLIAESCVSKKKIVKSKDGSTVRASSDELALAGKGFSETAENLFKKENPDIDFSVIDSMELYEISDEDLSAFIEEGHLCKE